MWPKDRAAENALYEAIAIIRYLADLGFARPHHSLFRSPSSTTNRRGRTEWPADPTLALLGNGEGEGASAARRTPPAVSVGFNFQGPGFKPARHGCRAVSRGATPGRGMLR